jgi:YidC/Oxa1 family membrane protein insertase
MALYQKEGANPFSSCLPMLIQTPFFLALYHMLSKIKDISGEMPAIGKIDKAVALQIEGSSFFGIKLSDTFSTVDKGFSGQIVIGAITATMCIVMFISQRLVSQKNIPLATKDDPMFKSQKMMTYIFPLMYIGSGAVLPVGLLLYLLTTNLWTLGQGVWQLHYMPTPGSEAAQKKEERENKAQQRNLERLRTENPEAFEEYNQPDELKPQREQPRRKKSRK